MRQETCLPISPQRFSTAFLQHYPSLHKYCVAQYCHNRPFLTSALFWMNQNNSSPVPVPPSVCGIQQTSRLGFLYHEKMETVLILAVIVVSRLIITCTHGCQVYDSEWFFLGTNPRKNYGTYCNTEKEWLYRFGGDWWNCARRGFWAKTVKPKMYTSFLYMADKQNHVSMRKSTGTTQPAQFAQPVWGGLSTWLDWSVAQSAPAVMTSCKNYMKIRKLFR